MMRKLAGYLLLSFFSFLLFTGFFHAAAHAQTGRIPLLPTPTPSQPSIAPTPTIVFSVMAAPSIAPLPNTTEPKPTPNETLQTTPPPPAPQQNTKQTLSPTPTSAPIQTAIPTTTPQPTATPVPLPKIIAPAELEPFFAKYAAEYGVDANLLKRIAKCEAHFNSQSDTGTYAGMYQFMAGTWISARGRMGMDPNPDLRKNAEESIRTAAFMIANGQKGAWPNCH